MSWTSHCVRGGAEKASEVLAVLGGMNEFQALRTTSFCRQSQKQFPSRRPVLSLLYRASE